MPKERGIITSATKIDKLRIGITAGAIAPLVFQMRSRLMPNMAKFQRVRETVPSKQLLLACNFR